MLPFDPLGVDLILIYLQPPPENSLCSKMTKDLSLKTTLLKLASPSHYEVMHLYS